MKAAEVQTKVMSGARMIVGRFLGEDAREIASSKDGHLMVFHEVKVLNGMEVLSVSIPQDGGFVGEHACDAGAAFELLPVNGNDSFHQIYLRGAGQGYGTTGSPLDIQHAIETSEIAPDHGAGLTVSPRALRLFEVLNNVNSDSADVSVLCLPLSRPFAGACEADHVLPALGRKPQQRGEQRHPGGEGDTRPRSGV